MENDKILIEKYNISRNPQLLNEQSSQLEFNNMTTKNTKNTSNIIDNDITY